MRLHRCVSIIVVCLLVLSLACEHAPEIKAILPPTDLQYVPQSIEITQGTGGQSELPLIAGSLPIIFTITSEPAAAGKITISPEGVIAALPELEAGSYQISVQAENSAGAASFPNAFSIQVNTAPTPPDQLRYEPSKMELVAGTAGYSKAPVLTGTNPIEFSHNATPDAGSSISIDEQGIIHADGQLPAGSYTIDVTATNVLGSKRFAGAYNIVVYRDAQPPSALSYAPNTLLLNYGNGGQSVVPGISGTSPMQFSVNVTPDAAGNITISDQGVITALPELPVGTFDISVTASNAAGSTTFDQIYQITVEEPILTTFTNDISPIISSRCGNCHTTGPQTLYVNYQNAKTDINLILDRIQRDQKAAGFMPKNGSKLSEEEISLFKKWLDDGLIE